MSSIKAYAQEVFDELNNRTSKNKFEAFLKEFNKLIEENGESHSNDVGCLISKDCSPKGCYRYSACDLTNKKR